MPDTWKQANIVSILKPHKISTLPSSYRPIAVLNQDYKLFTSILANRLNQIAPNYIQSEQTGVIAQRSTSDNIQRVLHIIHTCKCRLADSVALALGFQKAFDSVEFLYIQTLLKKYEFWSRRLVCD